MARSIAEIKKIMTDKLLSYETIRTRYNLAQGVSFDEVFSKYSIESIIFDCVAFIVWTIEVLFDKHATEVSNIITELKPHKVTWYADKAKLFMPGHDLVSDDDYYDTSAMSDQEIEAARVVKFAKAVDVDAVVYIKVAGLENDVPVQLNPDYETGLIAYFDEIGDAGVKIVIVNEPADHLRLTYDIYYNPMILNSSGINLADGSDPVRTAIRSFIADLPFNGEFRNSALTDKLQLITGVVMPELVTAEVSPTGLNGTWQPVAAFVVPDSGYYKIYDEEAELNLIFIPYETVSD